MKRRINPAIRPESFVELTSAAHVTFGFTDVCLGSISEESSRN